MQHFFLTVWPSETQEVNVFKMKLYGVNTKGIFFPTNQGMSCVYFYGKNGEEIKKWVLSNVYICILDYQMTLTMTPE